MIILTEEERQRWTAWLRQEQSTSEAMLLQMKAIAIPELVQKRERLKASAFDYVASHLEGYETMEVSNG